MTLDFLLGVPILDHGSTSSERIIERSVPTYFCLKSQVSPLSIMPQNHDIELFFTDFGIRSVFCGRHSCAEEFLCASRHRQRTAAEDITQIGHRSHVQVPVPQGIPPAGQHVQHLPPRPLGLGSRCVRWWEHSTLCQFGSCVSGISVVYVMHTWLA